MNEVLRDPILLIAVAIAIGKFFGKFEYKHFSLGSSAILFVGIVLVELLSVVGINDIEIPSVLFNISLNAFVTVVALIASSNLVYVVKKYGLKFILLALIVTGTAALLILGFTKLLPAQVYDLTGVFVGSLTSSPGFGNALEIAKHPVDMSAAVTLGYIMAYMPGVISVIIFGRLAANSYQKSKAKAEGKEDYESPKPHKENNDGFSIVKLAIVMAVGMFVGLLKVNFGEGLTFSLGGTGGCLFSALIFGCFVDGFKLDEDKLVVVRDISISAFLAIIGLKYGHRAVESLLGTGLILFPISIIVAVAAILAGYYFGKYVLKIEAPLLAGAICGGMTSTPGLAATLEAFDEEGVVTGYGATYPFGLIFTILFIKLFI